MVFRHAMFDYRRVDPFLFEWLNTQWVVNHGMFSFSWADSPGSWFHDATHKFFNGGSHSSLCRSNISKHIQESSSKSQSRWSADMTWPAEPKHPTSLDGRGTHSCSGPLSPAWFSLWNPAIQSLSLQHLLCFPIYTLPGCSQPSAFT